ncbi:hypothetical protein Taro_043771 [Colocasia esculenta]|uniref:Uncharacterized protein n=1 Tax=Colocasia esculenta TaxID=4460 RepID=A0A843WWL1_COLES|nr:hypothetical protein [Colocasia esculenta]
MSLLVIRSAISELMRSLAELMKSTISELMRSLAELMRSLAELMRSLAELMSYIRADELLSLKAADLKGSRPAGMFPSAHTLTEDTSILEVNSDLYDYRSSYLYDLKMSILEISSDLYDLKMSILEVSSDLYDY